MKVREALSIALGIGSGLKAWPMGVFALGCVPGVVLFLVRRSEKRAGRRP